MYCCQIRDALFRYRYMHWLHRWKDLHIVKRKAHWSNRKSHLQLTCRPTPWKHYDMYRFATYLDYNELLGIRSTKSSLDGKGEVFCHVAIGSVPIFHVVFEAKYFHRTVGNILRKFTLCRSGHGRSYCILTSQRDIDRDRVRRLPQHIVHSIHHLHQILRSFVRNNHYSSSMSSDLSFSRRGQGRRILTFSTLTDWKGISGSERILLLYLQKDIWVYSRNPTSIQEIFLWKWVFIWWLSRRIERRRRLYIKTSIANQTVLRDLRLCGVYDSFTKKVPYRLFTDNWWWWNRIDIIGSSSLYIIW